MSVCVCVCVCLSLFVCTYVVIVMVRHGLMATCIGALLRRMISSGSIIVQALNYESSLSSQPS